MFSNSGAGKGYWESFGQQKIKTFNPKWNQPWIFIEGIDSEAEAPILWPLDAKSQITGKDPDAGKDWGQEAKEAIENEMVGWHHWLNGHELEQTPGDSEGQGSLVCCSPWGHRVGHDLVTEQQQQRPDWVQIMALSLTSTKFSGPQFPYL